MKPKDKLPERWEAILAQKGDAPAILNTRGEVVYSFKQIEDRARDFESKVDGFEPGDVLAVQIGNHENWPSILIACSRRQVVVLPLEQSIADQQRDAALKVCHASAIVEKATTIRKIDDQPVKWSGQTPSLLKLTSGTTAEPQVIRFRSEQLLADCDQICETMGISDVDLNFGVIPVSHSYGFSNLLTPVIGRGVPMVLSRDRTPRAVLDDIARTNATAFPGMPVFYQAFCEMTDVPRLPKMRLCISAGAPLPLAIAKKFRERFGLSIHSFYGASECGGICYDRDAKLEVEGFVGAPMKDVDLEMIDPNARSSQIRVRTAAAGDGHFPESNEEKVGNGVFIPDDLLVRDGDGFKIVGRVSDLINVAGKKVSPAEIEQVLVRFRGVRQAIAFGRPAAAGLRNEEVAACVVADVDCEDELLEFCRRELSAWQVPRKIFILDSMPANERGKISRRELARQFSA
ncbi:MAG TPA: class I adenylate-forming enzyme family protein [Chthoniobacterales bacterium]|jgi:long-chain acyl-CoA synthetase|nr:class I adenylate-forming enzyme family protein [Chthoniobacterales bacterium]